MALRWTQQAIDGLSESILFESRTEVILAVVQTRYGDTWHDAWDLSDRSLNVKIGSYPTVDRARTETENHIRGQQPANNARALVVGGFDPRFL